MKIISKKSLILLPLCLAFLVLPAIGLGQVIFQTPSGGQAINVEALLLVVLNILWPVVVTVVIIFFVLAGFKFLTAQGDPKQLETARKFLMWGMGGVIVIILAFSIISTIRMTLGF